MEHGIKHAALGSLFDSRIALISIDNAVELAVKAFQGLPERARGTPIGADGCLESGSPYDGPPRFEW
jgi:hypothetical protein